MNASGCAGAVSLGAAPCGTRDIRPAFPDIAMTTAPAG